MSLRHLKFFIFILLFISVRTTGNIQSKTGAVISGNLFLDESWDSVIYLSYIPTYDDLYLMSNDMIIAKTRIDSSGSFEFNINFLPSEKRLYRLHIVKKGDSPATLIIGGKDENHLFLIANCCSDISLSSSFAFPPFGNITFKHSPENTSLQQIRNLVFNVEKSYEESSSSKRALIRKKLEEDLLTIADTSKIFLVSLYAIYESRFKNKYTENAEFYNNYLKKWKNQDNAYFKAFKKSTPARIFNIRIILFALFLILIMLVIIYFIFKPNFRKKRKLQKLSIQERKVFELLRTGATNQEISDQCNIGINTVKTHVRNVYSKLGIKSRKEILDIDL